MPKRIQLRRSAGWRLPPGAVKVDRSTKFGNPFRADRPSPLLLRSGAKTAAEAFRMWLKGEGGLEHEYPEKRRIILASLEELRGKDIACWCKPSDECHGDAYLEISNQ